MSRERLPDRRSAESYALVHHGIAYSVTVGFYEDGRVAEVFAGMLKAAGTPMDVTARDTAVLISIALQHGVDLETMRGATTKTADGTDEGLAGALLTSLMERT